MAINAFKVFRDALFFFRLRVCQFEYHCFVSLLVPKVGRRPWRCQFLRRLLLQCVAVEFACVPLFWDCQLLGVFGFLLFILWCLPKFVWGVHNGDFGHLHRCVDGPGGDCGRSLWRGSGYILQRALPSWAEEPRRGRGSVQRGVGQHPVLAAKRPGTCCTKIK